jgi:REP element-mobilizing transposase RayT
MEFIPERLYHVYNRGNNRQAIFFSYGNYLFFLRKIRQHLLPCCDLLAYCLMPNHFHLLLETKPDAQEKTLNAGFQTLLSSYTQAVNKQERRTGSLFQQHTKAKNLESADAAYATTCFHYIHQNPMKAGLVHRMENWEFSSFKDYCGLRKGTLCHQSKAFGLLHLPPTGEAFYEQAYQALPPEWIEAIF